MARRLILWLIVTFLVVATLSGGLALAAEGKPGGTLVVALNHAPRHFNGAVQSGIATMFSSSQLFASPIFMDKDWKPQPYLAESWDISKDGLTVILKLVKNATFHDGKPITSEDVAFSIMTIKANHPFKTMLGAVDHVETPDPHTAVVKLANPHPAILVAMSQPLCPIIPKHIFGDGPEIINHPMNMKPVGSGPFKFVEYKPGEHLVLERFDNFFKGKPYLDRLIVKIIPDAVNRVTALEKGEIQGDVYVNTALDISRYQKINTIQVEPMAPAVGTNNWLAFNTKKKPLDDTRVRQAIGYAIDRDFIIQRLHMGFSKRSTGPIAPGVKFYTADVPLYALNLDKANALLDEAGYPKKPSGERFSLTVDFIPGINEQQKNIAEYLKPQLKKIGLEINIRQAPDFPTWANWISNGEFDMTMDSVWNWGDPLIGVHRTYLTSNIRKGVIWSNTQGYSNPKVDELLDQATKTLDFEKRTNAYSEFQKIVVDECPQVFINTGPFYMAYDKKLKNLNTTIWGSMSPMYDVYWDK
jgi:peptide/nickel transport system substrate-binding protein